MPESSPEMNVFVETRTESMGRAVCAKAVRKCVLEKNRRTVEDITPAWL